MRKKYASSLPLLKEMFSDWSDEDLVFALEDADGVPEEAIDRITEGSLLPGVVGGSNHTTPLLTTCLNR